MANDKDWQRRTDEWIQMTNESRELKQKRLAEKKLKKIRGVNDRKN